MSEEIKEKKSAVLTELPKDIDDMTINEFRLYVANAFRTITDSFAEHTEDMETLRKHYLTTLSEMNKKLQKPVSTGGLHRRLSKLEKKIKQYEEKGLLR